MKIIHIISSINRGGAENHLISLAKRQAKNNDIIKIIYLRGDGYWSKYLKKINIKCLRFNLNNNFNFFQIIFILFKLNKFLKKEKPNIVHVHLAFPELLVVIIKMIFNHNFRFIVTKHLDSFIFEGSYGQNKFFNGLFFEKLIFKYADHVIFISKNVKNYFLKKIKNYKYKTSVVYYGIDRNYFKNQIKISSKNNIKNGNKFRSIRDNKSQFIILNIARHIPQKEVDKLIDGFYEFQKIENNCKLILVGNGPDTDKLKEKSKNLKLLDKIIWISYSENIKEIFLISDLFCLTSKYEGLGLVLLEALILKKTVVTINRSAMGEIINDNFNGIALRDKYTSKDLSGAFEKIKNNKKLKLKYQKNSLIFLKKNFSFEKMYSLINKIYSKN